jgi:hypothetical protein
VDLKFLKGLIVSLLLNNQFWKSPSFEIDDKELND